MPTLWQKKDADFGEKDAVFVEKEEELDEKDDCFTINYSAIIPIAAAMKCEAFARDIG